MKMWIGRNRDNTLVLSGLPIYLDEVKGEWYSASLVFTRLYPQCFPEVTFESSPMEVELKLIEK